MLLAVGIVAVFAGTVYAMAGAVIRSQTASAISHEGIAETINNATTGLAETLATNDTAGMKPTGGYDLPQSHMAAVRHVFEDPSLRVHHYCKPSPAIFMQCQLYDSDSSNATLIGIEYIIEEADYQSLPDREKPYWHAHRVELRPDRADPIMPELDETMAKEHIELLKPTYGKVIITWQPNDNLPSFPP